MPRYLTFFSYTLQLVQLSVCCIAVLVPVRLEATCLEFTTHWLTESCPQPASQFWLLANCCGMLWFCAYILASTCAQASKLRGLLTRFADDLSCSVFGMANAVTLMFYVLQWTTKDVVEGGDVERPPWLGTAGPSLCGPIFSLMYSLGLLLLGVTQPMRSHHDFC